MTLNVIYALVALLVLGLAALGVMVVILRSGSDSHEARCRFLEQISSGRWVLTMMAGICLVLLTLAHILKGEDYSVGGAALVGIISGVFTSYFHKPRNGNGDDNGHDEPEEPAELPPPEGSQGAQGSP